MGDNSNLASTLNSSRNAHTTENVEEAPQSGQSYPPTPADKFFSHNGSLHEKRFDTENVNREIEEFEESPNPTPLVETAEGLITTIPTPTSTPTPVYHTFSIHILALLMAFSVLGTLARLGLHALASYPGQSIFPLAWVQAVGCFVMGFALGLREPLTRLSVFSSLDLVYLPTFL